MNWLILAQASAPAEPPQSPGLSALFTMIRPFGVIFLIFYFLMIRPQKKQEKERQEMLKALKKNDRVVTIGGIQGVVMNVRDKDVTLRIDDTNDIRVRFSRSAISSVVTKEEDEGAKE